MQNLKNMNFTRLVKIINKNKSLIFVFFALILEGLFILISLRVSETYLNVRDYSSVTLYYSIISIIAFGLFSGLEQLRQSNTKPTLEIKNTIKFASISFALLSPIFIVLFKNIGLKSQYIVWAILYGFSYSIQYEIFGYFSFKNKYKKYSLLKTIDGFSKLLLVSIISLSINDLDSIIIAFSISPVVSIIIFLLFNKLDFQMNTPQKDNLKTFTNLTLQNFVCIFFLYGLPISEVLNSPEQILLTTNSFFAQTYSQVLQFCLVPLQFLFLPKLARKLELNQKISLLNIFEGFIASITLSLLYLFFTYTFGVEIIKYFFYESYNLTSIETLYIGSISVMILLIKSSSFYLIAIRKTHLIAISVLTGFIAFIVLFTLLNIQVVYLFLFSCLISLSIIILLNIKLSKNDKQ